MLKSIDTSDCKLWDSIVRSFSERDVYYLSGYAKAFEIHGDGQPHLLYYESDELRGINVVMLRDIAGDDRFGGKIPVGKYYDLATPYGYGGWIFEGGEDGKRVFCEEYTKWCKDQGIVSEFVRFHPVTGNSQHPCNEMYERVFLGNTVAIKLDDEEAIWARFTSKNRGHIRVAVREGVEIRIEKSSEAFDTFKRIYKTTMDHDDAKSYYYFDEDFFQSVRNDMRGCYSLFTAYLGNVAIASAIMLYEGKYMNYHLSGQLFEYRRYAGTNMILHEAAKWGCNHGYEWLHLGGGLGAKEDSLYGFKKSFYKKGEDKQFFVGKRIVDMDAYKSLVGLREIELSEGFFPKYRA